MAVTKTDFIWYQICTIRRNLLQDNSIARCAVSIIQLSEIISQDTSVQNELSNKLGIEYSVIKNYRNWIAHCNSFDYDELLPIVDKIKSDKCAALCMDHLYNEVKPIYEQYTMRGDYNSVIGQQI